MNRSENNMPQVIFLSGTGFPDAHSAYINKIRLMGKALLEGGWKPTVLSKGNSKKHDKRERGSYEGIDYLYLTDAPSHMSTLSRINRYFMGYFRESILLLRISQRSPKTVLIMSFVPVCVVLYYRVLSFMLGCKLVSSIMEYHPATAKGLFSRLNARFFDHWSYSLVDGVLPISHFLENLIRSKRRRTPSLILPVLADYGDSMLGTIPDKQQDNSYFLFCAGIGYMETIKFVIESYSLLESTNVQLVLILSGSEEEISAFASSIDPGSGISVYSGLPYADLFSLYTGATALLIPLQNTAKDRARFPQKIAEYLASGRPIITTNTGEIKHYFTNGLNALVVNDFDAGLFSVAMTSLLENPQLADALGKRGQEFGLNSFHYQAHVDRLSTFLYSLWQSQ